MGLENFVIMVISWSNWSSAAAHNNSLSKIFHEGTKGKKKKKHSSYSKNVKQLAAREL